jgi:uncharacterized membrane protein YqjE
MTALKNIASSLLDMLQTRLDLLTNELQILKLQLVQQLWMALTLMTCLVLAVLLFATLAVLVWWEQRFFVLALLAVLFSSLSVTIFMTMRRSASQKATPLTQSLAALQEDLRQLKQAAGHESTPR